MKDSDQERQRELFSELSRKAQRQTNLEPETAKHLAAAAVATVRAENQKEQSPQSPRR